MSRRARRLQGRGFPIAKFAKLAVGYLDELQNDITKETPACFEPTIDYCVVKIPRFAFEKFPGADPTLTTQMKSVGETMAIGRTFKETLQKALRGLETGHPGFGLDPKAPIEPVDPAGKEELSRRLRVPLRAPPPPASCVPRRLGVTDIHEATSIDPWFLENMRELWSSSRAAGSLLEELIRCRAKSSASPTSRSPSRSAPTPKPSRRAARLGIKPGYKLVDTCAAEFEAATPYYHRLRGRVEVRETAPTRS